MVHSKWLLLAALILAVSIQSGQGKQSEEQSRVQHIEKEGKIHQLHNVNSNESSETPSKSKFKKYSGTKKTAEVINADKDIARKNDKSKPPTKSPISIDETLDNMLKSMVGVLKSVSQDLHTAVQALSEEPEKEGETAISSDSSEDKGHEDALRDLDRLIGQMARFSQTILDAVVEDAENGIRSKSPNNENPDSKVEGMITAPTDPFSMLASFLLQDLPATNAQLPLLPPSFLRAAKSFINPKTSRHQEQPLLTKEI